jgi:hypothetical protein
VAKQAGLQAGMPSLTQSQAVAIAFACGLRLALVPPQMSSAACTVATRAAEKPLVGVRYTVRARYLRGGPGGVRGGGSHMNADKDRAALSGTCLLTGTGLQRDDAAC